MQKINQNRQYPISAYDPEIMYQAAKLRLVQVLPVYGCYEEIDIKVLEQAAALLVDYNSDLALDDLDLAYELWGGDKYPEKSVVPMYLGVFTLENIKTVLREFRKYRNKVIAATAEEEWERKFGRYEQLKHERYEDYLTEFGDHIKDLADRYAAGELHWNDYTEIPYRYYLTARASGVLTENSLLPGEKEAIWAEAKVLAAEKIRKRMSSQPRGLAELVKHMKGGMLDDENIRDVAPPIFHRLVFFRVLIQRAHTLPIYCPIDQRKTYIQTYG